MSESRQRSREAWVSRPKIFTERDREVLLFLIRFHKQHGYSATRSELQSHFGWRAYNAAYDRVRRLERMGYVETAPGPRAIRILKPPPPTGNQR